MSRASRILFLDLKAPDGLIDTALDARDNLAHDPGLGAVRSAQLVDIGRAGFERILPLLPNPRINGLPHSHLIKTSFPHQLLDWLLDVPLWVDVLGHTRQSGTDVSTAGTTLATTA